MLAEFEEKQYEQHMNIELLCKHDTSNLFPPGQFLENSLGFDVALYSCNRRFWKYFYKHLYWGWKRYFYYFFVRFPYIHPDDIKYLEELFKDYLDYIPKIKFNLFIQYKRPEHMKTKRSLEWEHWNHPYYRYQIIQHQQELLEKLAQNIDESSALVIYASPAFHTQKEFWENVQNKTIIDNSNYCEAERLSGHSRYTYINGGRYGIALSEPEEIKNINLEESIYELREQSKYEGNISTIINLAKQVEDSIKESDYGKYYSMLLESNELFRDFEEYRIFSSLVKLSLFSQITGVEILYGF